MIYVSADHKAELGQIHAIDMVLAHMVNIVPENETSTIPVADVNDYIIDTLDPIYEMCDRPQKLGLAGDGAIANANARLCVQNNFILRGGSDNSPEDLPYGIWCFNKGGRQAAIDWINSRGGYDGYFDYLIDLVADIHLNA